MDHHPPFPPAGERLKIGSRRSPMVCGPAPENASLPVPRKGFKSLAADKGKLIWYDARIEEFGVGSCDGGAMAPSRRGP